MKKLLVMLMALLLIPASVSAQTYYSWRYREHATDCTSLTDGVDQDICYEIDDQTIYKCEQSVGKCDTSGEWKLLGGGTDTNLTEEEVEDFVGTMLAGTETRITVTYDDAGNMINFVVDDMNDDVPDAGDFGNATDLDSNGALNTDSVSANEVNASGVEAELEAVMDLQDMQGAVTDAQVPDTVTITNNWTDTENTAAGYGVGDVLADGSVPFTAEQTVDALGLEFEAGDSISDCSSFSATGGGVFYDDSEGKLKKCEDNALSVLDTGGSETNSLETLTTGILVNEVPIGTSSGVSTYKAIPDCNVVGSALNYEDSTQTISCRSGFAASGSTAFDTISTGTNTSASMVVGTGASFATSGSGTIVGTDLSCTDCIGGTEITELTDTDVSDTLTASDLVAGSEVVSDAEVVDTITASNYLLLAGGTMTGSLVSDNLGIEYVDSDINPGCVAGEYKIYADTSETKLKKCMNGSATDLDTTGGTPDFSTLTGGTNTSATMIVGTGASFGVSGSGTNTATDLTCTDCINETEVEDIFVLSAGGTMTGTLNITNGGRLGISTTNPSGALHINSTVDPLFIAEKSDAGNAVFRMVTSDNIGTGAFQFGDTTTSNIGRIVYNHTDNDMGFYTLGTEQVTINSSGNVGIGTTIPLAVLDVVGEIRVSGGVGVGRMSIRDNVFENFVDANDTGSVGVNYNGYNGGASYFRDFRIFNGKNNELARFDGSSGNTGIGTTNPQAILDLLATDSALRVTRLTDPTTDITVPLNGMIAYDSTDDELHGYIGGAWVDLGQSGSGLSANSINFSHIDYSETLAGNPAMNADECFIVATATGGAVLCEGSVADTNEQLYMLPDENGADTTAYIATHTASITNLVGTGLNLSGTTLITVLGSAVDTSEIVDDTITHADIADADQECSGGIWFEDPTATDDFKSIWANKGVNDCLLTEIWAESDQTVNFDLQVDDGTPADVNGTDISPAAGEAEDTSLSGDTTVAAGEELDLAITSVSGTPTWVAIKWTGNWVD